MDETFYLTNVSPQVGVGFNRGVWKNLEERIRSDISSGNIREAQIVSGPLYVSDDRRGGKRKIRYQIIAEPPHR